MSVYFLTMSDALCTNLIVRSTVPRCRIQAGIPVKPPMLPAKRRRTITSMSGVSLSSLLALFVCYSVHKTKFVC